MRLANPTPLIPDMNSVVRSPVHSRSSEDVSIAPINLTNSFATPSQVSRAGSTTVLQVHEKRWFHSRRVKKGTIEQPWIDKKDPMEKWVTIIPLAGLFLGLVIAGVLVWDGIRSVVNHTYCLVLDEDWSSGFNSKVWMKEAEVGGFG